MSASTKSKSNLSSNNDGDAHLWKELSDNNSAIDEPHLPQGTAMNTSCNSQLHLQPFSQSSTGQTGPPDALADLAAPSDDKYHPASNNWGLSSASYEQEHVAEPIPQCQQLKISTLRKFDKFMRKYRRGTFTCSSKSCYSFNKDIDEMSEEQDQDSD